MGSGLMAAIYSPTDVTVTLSGTNTLTQTTAKNGYGIYGDSNVTIAGDGSLTATGTHCGIRTGYELIVSSGTVDASGNTYGIYGNYVTVNGGTVTAKALGGTGMDYAIRWDNTITVANGLTAVASATTTGPYSACDWAKRTTYDRIRISTASVYISGVTAAADGMVLERGVYWPNMYGEDITVVTSVGTYKGTNDLTALRANRNADKYLTTAPVVGETYYFDILLYGSKLDCSSLTEDQCAVTIDGYDVKYEGATVSGTQATLTFSAVKLITHNVVFYFGDSPIFGVEIGDGQTVTRPADPGQEGKTFFGWHTAEGNPYNFDTPVTKDINLYAIFGYAVTFHVDDTDKETQYFEEILTVTEPEDPVKEGLIFAGWFTEDGELYDFSSPLTADLNLYARFAPVAVGGVLLTDGYYLPSGSTTPTITQPSGGYAYYKDGVLTLNNYTYEGAGYIYNTKYNYSAVICSEQDLTIELKGENSLVQTTTDSSGTTYIKGNLTITGTGSLTSSGNGSGLYADGDITISGGTIVAQGYYYGIRSGEGDIIINGGTVELISTNTAVDGFVCAIEGDNITISDDLIAVAATEPDGTFVTYNPADNATYDHVKIGPKPAGNLGDLNLDGDVDSDDLTMLARHVGGIETVSGKALVNADVNSDGKVDSDDLTKHARFVGGIITSWDQE